MFRSHYFFFFSSRRRHTRWTGDWSSDVCSSDLDPDERAPGGRRPDHPDAIEAGHETALPVRFPDLQPRDDAVGARIDPYDVVGVPIRVGCARPDGAETDAEPLAEVACRRDPPGDPVGPRIDGDDVAAVLLDVDEVPVRGQPVGLSDEMEARDLPLLQGDRRHGTCLSGR